jgi:hypothetical protein
MRRLHIMAAPLIGELISGQNLTSRLAGQSARFALLASNGCLMYESDDPDCLVGAGLLCHALREEGKVELSAIQIKARFKKEIEGFMEFASRNKATLLMVGADDVLPMARLVAEFQQIDVELDLPDVLSGHTISFDFEALSFYYLSEGAEREIPSIPRFTP